MKIEISDIVTSSGRNGSAIALNRESLVKIQRGPATVSEEAFCCTPNLVLGKAQKRLAIHEPEDLPKLERQ